MVGDPKAVHVTPSPNASRAATVMPGETVEMGFDSSDRAVHVEWAIVRLEGSNCVRQVVTVAAQGKTDVPISRVELIELKLAGAHVVGSEAGSPIVAGNLFLGLEHPLSTSNVIADRAMAWIDRQLPLKAYQAVTYSAVIGVAREGQMRRDFLTYLERERAHPYRTSLHYNSWYELGLFTPYSATDAVERRGLWLGGVDAEEGGAYTAQSQR